MAFPTIRSSACAQSPTATTTIDYPPTVVAGDVLLFMSVASTSTAESGWTLIADGGTSFQATVQYKIADGTEGGGSFTAAVDHYGRCMLAIDAGDGVPEAAAAAAASFVDTPDPPSLSPSGGAKDYLWVVYGRGQGTTTFQMTITAPSGFTLEHSENGLAVAYKNENVATLDPGVFGDSGTVAGTMYASTAAIPFVPRYSPGQLFFACNF